MKNIKATLAAATILSAVILPMMTGCISVKREVEPTSTSTTTTTVRPSTVAPTSTTVERTTTY